MHAPSADLTLLGMAFGTRPQRIRDLQIVAGFVGLGAGQGLADPAGAGARRAPGQGRALHRLEPAAALATRSSSTPRGTWSTCWSWPTSSTAAARELGREEWVAEEHERRYGPDARIVPDPELAWRRVKGSGRLAARTGPCWPRWPPGASARPADATARRPGWSPTARSSRSPGGGRPTGRPSRASAACPTASGAPTPTSLLEAVRAGEAAAADAEPSAPPPEAQHRLDVLGPLGAVLVTARAEAVDLAPSLRGHPRRDLLVPAGGHRRRPRRPAARHRLAARAGGRRPDRAGRGAPRAGGRRARGPT